MEPLDDRAGAVDGERAIHTAVAVGVDSDCITGDVPLVLQDGNRDEGI